ncbi:hypothetical protein PIB30_084450 [Stylosanthes scabra]|uniref:Uncharacterized protein n=1 Tax=Stylosanthes scabra TaxID=79078 RepID=A0ABU6ZR41_9FABA|nr:hypothetical protein [Stylosanthes scabra]
MAGHSLIHAILICFLALYSQQQTITNPDTFSIENKPLFLLPRENDPSLVLSIFKLGCTSVTHSKLNLDHDPDKAEHITPPTRARVDKKGKKVIQTPPTRASARLAALKTSTSSTPPPASSTPAMSQPAVKKPIFIHLTKDSESEGGSKGENPERKLANALRRMIGLGELENSDSDLGLPSSTSSSSEEDDVIEDDVIGDDVIGDDPRFWDYDDLEDWGAFCWF